MGRKRLAITIEPYEGDDIWRGRGNYSIVWLEDRSGACVGASTHEELKELMDALSLVPVSYQALSVIKVYIPALGGDDSAILLQKGKKGSLALRIFPGTAWSIFATSAEFPQPNL